MDAHKRRGPADAVNADRAEDFSHNHFTTAGIVVDLAIGRRYDEAGTPVQNHALAIADLIKRVTTHTARDDKMRSPYICAPMRGERRNAGNALPWRLFCLDFDGKHDHPDPAVSKAFFAATWHCGYTTHSYTPENGKHRVVLLLDRAITAAEHRELHNALADMLPFEPDAKLNHPDQPVFMPSCPPGATPVAWFNDGRPLDVDAMLAEHRSKTEAESRAQKAYKAPAGQDSVIAAFNAAHDLAEILERHGYQRNGRKYLHPNSESGVPSVSILGNGSICFSHSSSDPLGDARVHDAFDVFCILGHRGNKSDATRAAAELLGMQLTGRGPSVHMADAAEDDADDDGKDGRAVIDRIVVDDILSDGPPILRRYADYAMAGSAFKVTPWAFAGALAFVGLGTARFWYGPTGLSTSILQVILGPTESGKDKVVVDPLATLLAAADKAFVPRNGEALAAPMFTSRIVNRISSGKALEARLEAFPATTFIANEMGGMFARMGGPKADGLMVQLKELLLAAFGKESSIISEKVFAHAPERVSTPIVRPCLSVIGLMTSDQAKAFDRETVKDGLLNRFIVVPSPRLAMHPVTRSPEVDQELIDWLLQCHQAASAMGDTPTTVGWGRGAESAFSAMALAAHESLEDRPLNHRFAMKALKLALIFAVARNFQSPEIRVVDLELAKAWLDRTNDAAMRAILLAGGMANGEHHADLLKLAIELQDKGEGGHIPISRVFHHRSSEARESAIRNAIQVGIADVVTSSGEVISESVMRERGLARGLRLVPRMAGVRRFMSMSGRA